MGYFDKIIEEYSREHEEEVGDEIKESGTKYSHQISCMISGTLKAGHHVYLVADWHLWRFDKKKKIIKPRSDFDTIIENYKKKVTDADLVIFMGDLIDGEVEKKRELGEVLDSLPGVKVLVRGNNDLFWDEYYKEHGFKYVTPKFIYNNMLFSHIPQAHNTKLNIHAHIHGYATYWLPWDNMIDVAFVGARKEPVDLKDVIEALPKYRKKVKVIPEKFGQEFATL